MADPIKGILLLDFKSMEEFYLILDPMNIGTLPGSWGFVPK
jgi:hypothetical protein